MIKVLFIDDEPRLRQAWERLFASQPDLRIVGMLARVDDLPAAVAELAPDVVVMDLSVRADPFESIARTTEAFPEVRIIVYSARSDEQSKKAAVDAGAWGYVDKLAEIQEVFDVIRRVSGGEVILPMEERHPDLGGSAQIGPH